MYQINNGKVKSKKGMTMAEMLIVVAITVILAAVAFIWIMNYQRNMAQFERDRIAKEILIAAQNHLTVAKGEKYPGLTVDLLDPDENEEDIEKAVGTKESGSDGVYYIKVNKGDVFGNADAKGHYMLEQMLPDISIDETIRLGGSYVIRYQPSIGKIMDVFYCSTSGSPDRFNYELKESDYSDAGDYSLIKLNKADKAAAEKRREFKKNGEDRVLGWCGGEHLEKLGEKIKSPRIKVNNENTLNVESWYGDKDDPTKDVKLELVVKGKQSKARKYLSVDKTAKGGSASDLITASAEGKAGTVVLDDITAAEKHFAKLFEPASKTDTTEKKFIPGEDLQIRAIAFCTTKLANVAESKTKEVNSLFENITDAEKTEGASSSESTYTLDGKQVTIGTGGDSIPDTAYIGNARHLENLDKYVSNLDAYDETDGLSIKKAVQTKDINWNTFINDTENGKGTKVCYNNSSNVNLYNPDSMTAEKKYKPVDPTKLGESFTYDGKTHSINNVAVDTSVITAETADKNGGLFSTVNGGTIKNIKLIDFDINCPSADAGALAGSLRSSNVTNVIAVDSSGSPILEGSTEPIKISGTNAGGLIGKMTDNVNIEYSAAAVRVEGSSAAGGLAGSVAGSSSIKDCQSGGHTKNGSYKEWIKEGNSYDVTGSSAGGLVGSFAGTKIENSYSTCSVSATAAAGGFVGSSTGGMILNSYCTGLVNDSINTAFAFIGSGSSSVGTGNMYYSIINRTEANKKEGIDTKEMGPGSAAVNAFDENTEAFKAFTNAGIESEKYDSGLKGKYILKKITVPADPKKADYFVNKHYGDWPTPEIFIIND